MKHIQEARKAGTTAIDEHQSQLVVDINNVVWQRIENSVSDIERKMAWTYVA